MSDPIGSPSELPQEHKRALLAELLRQKARRSRSFPLSFAQQRLWFAEQLEPGHYVYNIPRAVSLSGPLDPAALECALHEIVRRHEILRTTFAAVDGSPVQRVQESRWPGVSVIDLQGWAEPERGAGVKRLMDREIRRPFDLATGPLMRVTLLRLGEQEHVLLFDIHHIVFDDWSWGVLFQELGALYDVFTAGRRELGIGRGRPAPASPLPELPIQYADFALWQRDWLQGEVLEDQLAYWRHQLGSSRLVELPADRPRPEVPTFWAAWQPCLEVPGRLTSALQSLSRQEGVTLFMLLLAAFQTLLFRYTGQEDLVVGTDVANRNRIETEGLIGFFINHLVLRTDLSGNPSFRELLGRVREVALDAYAHQDLPFDKLVEVLQPKRALGHTPLFQVLFVFQNVPSTPLKLSGLTVRPLEIDNGTCKFDLSLFVRRTGEGLVGTWVYKTDLFEATTITRMTAHLQRLLESIVAQPDAPVSTLEFLTPAERERLTMLDQQREDAQLRKLRGARRKSVDLS
jgi:hypothetical protein